MITLNFDEFGWWDRDSITELRKLNCNEQGWYGITPPPKQQAFFVPGALTAEAAVLAGMPAEAAGSLKAKITTPAVLLD